MMPRWAQIIAFFIFVLIFLYCGIRIVGGGYIFQISIFDDRNSHNAHHLESEVDIKRGGRVFRADDSGSVYIFDGRLKSYSVAFSKRKKYSSQFNSDLKPYQKVI
jgi:hypothetical protein